MAENKELLILRLDGVLQSWGELSKWDFRDSSSMPTKSGIVGLLGCAMGAERGSQVLTDLSRAISVAVRADRPGSKTIDFQTVTGHDLMTANGIPRRDGSGAISNTIITPRAYVQDAVFTVFIDTDEYWRAEIVAALKHPKWSIYLGRKCCVPNRPVFQEVSGKYESLMDAVNRYPAAYRANYPMMYECEEYQPDAITLLRSDELVSADRQYGLRRVWRGTVKEDANVSE